MAASRIRVSLLNISIATLVIMFYKRAIFYSWNNFMVASKTSGFIPDRKTKLLPAFNRFFEISMGIFTT